MIDKDNRTPLMKKCDEIAMRSVSELREASDAGRVATPLLVAAVQSQVSTVLQQLFNLMLPLTREQAEEEMANAEPVPMSEEEINNIVDAVMEKQNEQTGSPRSD